MKYHQEERLMTVIIGPHISEKSTIQAERIQSNCFQSAKGCDKERNKTCY